MQTFQEILAGHLAAFEWTIGADEIPEYEKCTATIAALATWYYNLDEHTQHIVRECDLTPGLTKLGYFNDWPSLGGLLVGNPFGRFTLTMKNIGAAVDRSHYQVSEQVEDSGLSGG